jgi:hypothetical protein
MVGLEVPAVVRLSRLCGIDRITRAGSKLRTSLSYVMGTAMPQGCVQLDVKSENLGFSRQQ